MSDENWPPVLLRAVITALYTHTEDCAAVDREWAYQRGFILPTDGTSQLKTLEKNNE